MIIKQRSELIAKITTNHSMTIEEALTLAGYEKAIKSEYDPDDYTTGEVPDYIHPDGTEVWLDECRMIYDTKILTIDIPTGNWFEDGTLEIGNHIEIEYADKDDLLESIGNDDIISEDAYRVGLIDGISIKEWIEKNL